VIEEQSMPRADVQTVLDGATRLLVVPHSHADIDALGSAVGLASSHPGEAVVAEPDVAESARPLLAEAPTDAAPDPAAFDAVAVVDTSARSRVDWTVPEAVPLVVVDHHEPGDLLADAAAAWVVPDAGATAELVFELVTEAGRELEPTGAYGLAAGLLDDTGFLRYAGPDSFERLIGLLPLTAGRARDLPDLLAQDPDFSERMACAKGVLRTDGYRVGDTETLVGLTRTSWHQAAVARALRGAGFDAVVVLSAREDEAEVWVTGRCAEDVGLDLPAELLDPLAESFGGEAGGHAGAAVAKLATTDADAVSEAILDRLRGELGPLSPLE
jgi:nanoRNase/pAp phosphatase (c-di-AMP/oligoRNAs hydrolase)